MAGSNDNQRVIVVVGAGLAGLRTLEALRRQGWQERVVVVGAETHMPYTRPPLSKKLLIDGGTHADVALRMRPSEHETQWRLGRGVVASDLANRMLRLDDGTTLRYDGLVAASGVRPRRLPDSVGGPRQVIRTVDDALAVSARLTPGTRVVVIGAGFIGCEVAAAATVRGCAVAVVAVDAVPMQTPLGRLLGTELRRRHAAAGVEFHLGTGVTRVDGERVRLADGSVLRADVVVEAIGSVPCTEWLAGNDLDLTDGVRCDGWLRMGGRRGVVAVGDVARFPNPLFGDDARRVEHWQVAADSAAHAATTLVHDLEGVAPAPGPFTTVPTFWSDQGVVRIRAFGLPRLGDRCAVLEGDLTGEAAIGYHSNDALVGVVLLGMARQSSTYLRHLTEELAKAKPGSEAQ
ncbi:FAD-dependent oxidoreductase [Dactylosporangium sp. AC04546]|uniref:NAD(P)/FAD-dependent oxidoreductase n=1 Tax=Dactylosporangium sp. AC04546 TaxID=2862460 RepID=UPI001EE127A6|nr:FAD-dependent oxidoreductase [Dactylosporangium sp. AC04546]WVK80779.1 FAD-dependent oxidoreductase [Dactylosporangium sp. AC04546]